MAMVEFVIILPLLLTMLFALAEFGVVFGRYQTLTNAAREGARTAVVYRANCVVANVETEVRTRVKNYASPLGVALSDGDITVNGVCGAKDTSSTVIVNFNHPFVVLPNFSAGVGPTLALQARSVMRNEGSS
jgi:Flp pilus assembly protein TadG